MSPPYIHNLNLKFTVQLYMRSLFNPIGTPIGKWFERDYILQYQQDRLEYLRFMAWDNYLPTPEDTYALPRYVELSIQYRKALWLNDKPLGKLSAALLRTPLL